MPFSNLQFKPGIDKESTDYGNEGGWVDGNLVRFRKGAVEKIGGWVKSGTNSFLGLARALHSWISLGGTRYIGVGTTLKYYIEDGQVYYDITPIRETLFFSPTGPLYTHFCYKFLRFYIYTLFIIYITQRS